MKVAVRSLRRESFGTEGHRRPQVRSGTSQIFERFVDRIAPTPWGAHAGFSPWGVHHAPGMVEVAHFPTSTSKVREPLYTPEERVRRDESPWTIVQGVLAPLQFLIFAVSVALIARYLVTGQGYALATASILLKTVALYAIMVTGSIWEKVVFGKWLFARPFFWEDVFSMLVLGLQTAYLAALFLHIGSPAQQMLIAVAAYAAYAVNATQFLLKLRAARLDAAAGASPAVLA
jgi:3-vinyl bacteriochlorophyllide hydratase